MDSAADRAAVPVQPSSIAGGVIALGGEPRLLAIADGIVDEIRPGPGDATFALPDGWFLAPGLVDIQVNGGNGIHLASEPHRLAELAEALPASGVTTFLPTLPSPTIDELRALSAALAELPDTVRGPAAHAPGIHVEGPAISPARRGAHPQERLISPAEFERFVDVEGVHLVTIAPELDGALDIARGAMELGRVVAAGHTDGSFEDGLAAIDAGVRLMTHAFNGSRPIHHRDPGITAAYLTRDDATVCVICDGRHLAPGAVALVAAAKPADRIAIVTDAIAPTRFGGAGDAPVTGPLMGGLVGLDVAAANFAAYAGAAADVAMRSASEIPAAAAGLPLAGIVEAGAPADLVAVDADGRLGATWVGGRLAHASEDFVAACG